MGIFTEMIGMLQGEKNLTFVMSKFILVRFNAELIHTNATLVRIMQYKFKQYSLAGEMKKERSNEYIENA